MVKIIILSIPLFISAFCSSNFSSADFHFVDLFKNYTDARSYCREMYNDLATVGNSADMGNLIASVPSNLARAWIGLQEGNAPAWHWSLPGQKLHFLNWKEGEPQDKNQDSCGAMNSDGKWFESDCNTKRGFVCEGNFTIQNIFFAVNKSWREAQHHCRGISTDLVSIQSAVENKAVQNEVLSETVWIGLFKDPWAWSDGSNSSFRFWKTNQPNYLKDQNCVVAVFKDDGRWNDLKCSVSRRFICHGARTGNNLYPNGTIPYEPTPWTITVDTTETSYNATVSSTHMPSTNSSEFTDDLILIQQNMSWKEASHYCREHHDGLVSVHNEEEQERVVRKSENATSPHVWLGLRYTCTFNFWFWMSSYTAGHYQNWAPGHGSEVQYGCSVTGALETTGGQQWVGLPETEKLNFICYTCAETTNEEAASSLESIDEV